MRMSKGILYAGLASAILFAVSAPAQAAGVPVTTDIGFGMVANVTGTGTPGDATLQSSTPTTITSVTAGATTYTSFSPTLTLNVAASLTDVAGVITGTASKAISDGTNTIVLHLNVTSGTATANELSLTATIIGASGSTDLIGGAGGFDFSALVGGSTTIIDNQTGGNFNTILSTGTGSATAGALTVTEIAATVPEPSSMALLGIGMTGFLAFRRFFKRPATA